MTFTYERTIAAYYNERLDETFEDSYDFVYEPESEDVLEAIISFLMEDGTSLGLELITEETLRETIEVNDLQDQLERHYYERLKEYFEEDALESERGN